MFFTDQDRNFFQEVRDNLNTELAIEGNDLDEEEILELEEEQQENDRQHRPD